MRHGSRTVRDLLFSRVDVKFFYSSRQCHRVKMRREWREKAMAGHHRWCAHATAQEKGGCTRAGKMAHGTLGGEMAHFKSEAAHSNQCAAFEPKPALALFENVPPSVKPSVPKCHVSIWPVRPLSLLPPPPPHKNRRRVERARQNGCFRVEALCCRHRLP